MESYIFGKASKLYAKIFNSLPLNDLLAKILVIIFYSIKL